jgi:hypothetical protein
MPGNQQKRDIAADRAELDSMFERAKRRNDVIFPFVYAIVSHYIDRTETAEQRADRAEAENQRRMEHYAQIRTNISRWLEVEEPELHGLCEDCEHGHPKTCHACPDLLEALWIADDLYHDIINGRKNPRPGTPEKPLAKKGYAAMKAERDQYKRMVEAGVDALAKLPVCPPYEFRDHSIPGNCSKSDPRYCVQCQRHHLAQKAKEGEKR